MAIEEYIKSNDKFSLMPFVTVYATIMELINDGLIEQSAFEKGGCENVAVCEQKSTEQGCGRLYSAGDFHGNR